MLGCTGHFGMIKTIQGPRNLLEIWNMSHKNPEILTKNPEILTKNPEIGKNPEKPHPYTLFTVTSVHTHDCTDPKHLITSVKSVSSQTCVNAFTWDSLSLV